MDEPGISCRPASVTPCPLFFPLRVHKPSSSAPNAGKPVNRSGPALRQLRSPLAVTVPPLGSPRWMARKPLSAVALACRPFQPIALLLLRVIGQRARIGLATCTIDMRGSRSKAASARTSSLHPSGRLCRGHRHRPANRTVQGLKQHIQAQYRAGALPVRGTPAMAARTPETWSGQLLRRLLGPRVDGETRPERCGCAAEREGALAGSSPFLPGSADGTAEHAGTRPVRRELALVCLGIQVNPGVWSCQS